MTHRNQKLLKYSFFFFLVLTIYYSFVWLILPFFTDPQLHRFEKYNRLWNWDLKQHARGDFDADGKEDLISFTGCAFLSAVDVGEIPESQRCTAKGIAAMSFQDEENRIGQKYIPTDIYDLHLGAFDNGLSISHSYLGKDIGENWKIFTNSSGNLKTYEIKNTGQLSDGGQPSFASQVDEFLYSISRFFVLLALPLIPLSFIFTPLFQQFRPITTQVPIHEVVTLSVITLILWLLWKRTGRSHVK